MRYLQDTIGALSPRHLRSALASNRILIAEDDACIARQISDYMKSLGFECRMARTISEAANIIELWQPHSILIDLMLPESNAVSLCRFVRSKPLKVQPTIVVMSGFAQTQAIESVRRAGADHFLAKPLNWDELFWACVGALGSLP
jgi:DNA-binding response OmpR family regulator